MNVKKSATGSENDLFRKNQLEHQLGFFFEEKLKNKYICSLLKRHIILIIHVQIYT